MSTLEIPDLVLLAVKKAAEAAFFRQTSPIVPVRSGLEFVVDADISQRSRCLGEKPVWFGVRFLIPRTFPNDVAHCIPMNPLLRWHRHQNGDWPLDVDSHANVICPPALSEANPAELLQPYITHAHEWISDAQANELARPGQRFEMPHFCKTSARTEIVYAEGGTRVFDFLNTHRRGLARIYRRKRESPAIVRVDRLEDAGGTNKLEAHVRRDAFGEEEFVGWAPWVFAGSPIVQGPHRPPLSIDDLTVEVKERLVAATAHAASQDERASMALLAFAVPRVWHARASAVRWQAVELDDIKQEDLRKPKKGFRKGSALGWPGVQRFIARNKKIRYMKTRDISSDALLARAGDENPLHRKNVAVLGVGAIGSMLTCSIGKLNPARLVLIDNQRVEPGNLIRHEASPNLVECSKAIALAVLTENVEHGSIVRPLDADIVSTWGQNRPTDADLIIDATGDPGVHQLVFKDVGLGPRALAFVAPGPAFGVLLFVPHAAVFDPREVHDRVRRELRADDLLAFDRPDTVAPEAGCHHPTFPAPYFRMRLMADTMLATMLAALRTPPAKAFLTIYAQRERTFGLDTVILHQVEC